MPKDLAISSNDKRVLAVRPQDCMPFSKDCTPFYKVFELKDDEWRQVAQDIPSYAGFQLQTMSISGEGDRVVIIGPAGDYVAAYDEIMVELV